MNLGSRLSRRERQIMAIAALFAAGVVVPISILPAKAADKPPLAPASPATQPATLFGSSYRVAVRAA